MLSKLNQKKIPNYLLLKILSEGLLILIKWQTGKYEDLTQTKVIKPFFFNRRNQNCRHGCIIYFHRKIIKILSKHLIKVCIRDKLLDTSLIVNYGKTSFEK